MKKINVKSMALGYISSSTKIPVAVSFHAYEHDCPYYNSHPEWLFEDCDSACCIEFSNNPKGGGHVCPKLLKFTFENLTPVVPSPEEEKRNKGLDRRESIIFCNDDMEDT